MIKLKHDFIYGSIENEAKMIAGLVMNVLHGMDRYGKEVIQVRT